jgi:hypothetical protein
MNAPLSPFGTFNIPLAQPNVPPRPVFWQDPTNPTVLHFTIDNSTLERFMTCPRSSEYFVINRRTAANISPALNFGKAIHIGIENLLLGHSLNDAILSMEPSFIASPPPEGDYRTFDMAVSVLQKYHTTYFPPVFNVVTHNARPFVEQPFDIILGEIDVYATLPYTEQQLLLSPSTDNVFVSKFIPHWTGKLDAAVTYVNNDLWIMDHKTTSMGGQGFFDEFNLSSQTIGYAWALERMLKKRPNGFVLDAIICRRPTKTGKSIELMQQRYVYDEWALKEWEENIKTLVADFLSHTLRGLFPQATKWCVGKYGRCPYFDVCTLPPENRRAMLSSGQFMNATWSPLT